jgi:tetratricopeptide (TPR) repeat protein
MEPSEKKQYLLEERQVFSRSKIWSLQRRYFAEKGIEAWRQGEVPQYITCNPSIANSYAEIVFAFWCDQNRLAPGSAAAEEPLSICELGAGSGRFAYHFLYRLSRLCEQCGVALTSFRYVLTDFTPSTLDSLRRHPRFRDFLAGGVLETARFDIAQSESLDLEVSGRSITAGSLRRPLVVIANYVFDSIPSDLFYFDAAGCHLGLLSLLLDEEPGQLGTADLLTRLQYRYDYRRLTEPPYADDALRALLAGYQRTLSETHLLFPAEALRCLQRLRALSQDGLLLLSADKGDHRLAALQRRQPPILVSHGSFSLTVNYDAFRSFCEQSSGLSLVPGAHPRSLSVVGLLMVRDAESHLETRRAYRRHVQDFGPDDFFSIIKHARKSLASMSLEDILAYLRLSYFDSQQLSCCLPRLLKLAPGLDQDQRQALTGAVDRVWEQYFPLVEAFDLGFQIAGLLYALDDYAGALVYLERSVESYGEFAGTLYNMAVCHKLLGHQDEAESLARKVLQFDPGNRQAQELLAGE